MRITPLARIVCVFNAHYSTCAHYTRIVCVFNAHYSTCAHYTRIVCVFNAHTQRRRTFKGVIICCLKMNPM